MNTTPRRLLSLLMTALASAVPAAAQTYCECWEGLGPCGNDPPTAVPSGCTNSTGQKAFLGPNGSTSVASDDLVLHASSLPGEHPALLFMGAGETRTPFGDGVLCVTDGGVGIFRFAPATTNGDGILEHGPGLAAYTTTHFPPPAWIQPGDTWHFQLWYRDPEGPCGSGFNLTNGVGFTFTP